MMGSVKGRPLPEETSGTLYDRTDQTSFLDIYVEGRRVLGSCVSTNEELGWASAGRYHWFHDRIKMRQEQT